MPGTGVNPRIGIAGPILFDELRQYLWHDQQVSLPKGLGGTPVNHLAQGLLDCGNRLVIYTLDPAVMQLERFDGPDLTIWVGPYRARRRAMDFFAKERSGLLRAMTQDPADLIHAHWSYEFALAAMDAGRPTVVTVHDVASRILRFTPDLYRFVRWQMNYQVMRRAPNKIAVSDYIFRSLPAREKERTWIIPNGLVLGGSLALKTNANNRLVCATVLNGFSKLKNGRMALDAFQRAKCRQPAMRLRMYGSGYERGGPAHQWAVQNRVDEGVEFVGPMPRSALHADLVAHVGMFLHPSLEESFSMATVEAMALGLPVIGGIHSGAVPWVLDYGRAGMLVDVTSVMAVANAMVQLAADRSLAARLVAEASEQVQRRFDIGKVVQQHLAVYKQILG